MYSTEILLKKAKIREVDSTAITFFAYCAAIETQDYMPLLTAPSYKQPNKLSQLQNTWLNLLTLIYSDFPCCLKRKRGTLALIDCRSKCKKGKGCGLSMVHKNWLWDKTSFLLLPWPWSQIKKSGLCWAPIRLQDLLPCPLGKKIEMILTFFLANVSNMLFNII